MNDAKSAQALADARTIASEITTYNALQTVGEGVIISGSNNDESLADSIKAAENYTGNTELPSSEYVIIEVKTDGSVKIEKGDQFTPKDGETEADAPDSTETGGN